MSFKSFILKYLFLMTIIAVVCAIFGFMVSPDEISINQMSALFLIFIGVTGYIADDYREGEYYKNLGMMYTMFIIMVLIYLIVNLSLFVLNRIFFQFSH
ncbi:MAG: hypothetical protein ACQERD_08255 [Campylobacterota bacterium]